MSVPIVEHRPPFLSVFAEVIWGYARYVQGHAVGVKLEQFTMRPHIRRIVSDEDGNVANQCDVASLGLFGQNRPSSLEALLMLRDGFALRPCSSQALEGGGLEAVLAIQTRVDRCGLS